MEEEETGTQFSSILICAEKEFNLHRCVEVYYFQIYLVVLVEEAATC